MFDYCAFEIIHIYIYILDEIIHTNGFVYYLQCGCMLPREVEIVFEC